MTIQTTPEDPELPVRPPVPREGLLIDESFIGKAEPPFWDLLLDAGARTAMTAAQRAIFNHSPSSDQDLVTDLLRNFAGWVLNLPASENHHHACPNGLYRHSLEVASYAVQELDERSSRRGGCPVLTPAEQALWLKVTFALGLFHDAGKILDVDVRLSESGPRWDPLKESLAAFKARHGVDALAPTPHRFRRGRGLTGHEPKAVPLLPVILAGRRWDGLRAPLAAACAALALRHQAPSESVAVPLGYLVERVHRADVRSAQQGMKLRR